MIKETVHLAHELIVIVLTIGNQRFYFAKSLHDFMLVIKGQFVYFSYYFFLLVVIKPGIDVAILCLILNQEIIKVLFIRFFLEKSI